MGNMVEQLQCMVGGAEQGKRRGSESVGQPGELSVSVQETLAPTWQVLNREVLRPTKEDRNRVMDILLVLKRWDFSPSRLEITYLFSSVTEI